MASTWKYNRRQRANADTIPAQDAAYHNEEMVTIFKDNKKLAASDFKNVWSHYDTDLNGFIEADELDSFLADLFAAQGHHMCKQELESLRTSILECYDENRDGKIEILEMTRFLPVEDNFLLYFRLKGSGKMTCVDFLELWKHYDKDKSGFLEEKEIGNFLHDVLQINRRVSISENEMSAMVGEVMKNFDYNRDGRIEFKEMKNFLNVEDNVLTKMSLTKNLSTQQFNSIFDYYDTDRNNYLENDEIRQFVLDLMEKAGTPLTDTQKHDCVSTTLLCIDTDKDGRISREELASFFYTEQGSDHRMKKTRRSAKLSKSTGSVNGGQQFQSLADQYVHQQSVVTD